MSDSSAVTMPPARGAGKTQHILAAAERLFRAHGYGATSMEAVAREAGVSKATLYAHFAGKSDLFLAIVTELENTTYASLVFDPQRDMREMLLEFAHTIVTDFVSPELVSAYRMVVAEATRFPELGQIFYRIGAKKLHHRLEQVFAQAVNAGYLRPMDTRRATEQFIGVVRGDLQLRALLDDTIDDAELNDIVRNGADVFYRAYRPE